MTEDGLAEEMETGGNAAAGLDVQRKEPVAGNRKDGK